MGQKQTIKRQSIIINLLRTRGLTFNEIKSNIENRFNNDEERLFLSKRTFQRDIKDIASLWDIEIKYNTSTLKYEIVTDQTDNQSKRLLESLDIVNTINATKQVSDFIFFEEREAGGTHFILDIITAIKNTNVLIIRYNKQWGVQIHEYFVEPLAIKEYRYRWYLLAVDRTNNKKKIFGLDRIFSIEQSFKKFTFPSYFNVKDYFNYTYGVIKAKSERVETIILSFIPIQGKYIKSLPMHNSQKIIIDNNEELRISLKIEATVDFIMDLLYFGENIKVLEPKWLVDHIKIRLKNAYNKY